MRSDNGKTDWPEWLGLRRLPDLSKARWLGRFFGFVLMALAALLIVGGIATLWLFLGHLLGDDSSRDAIRNLAIILAGMLGAPFVIWRATVAQKQVNVAEQGQITERITKAVAGLGAEKSVKKLVETPRYQKNEDGTWKQDKAHHPVPAVRPDGQPIITRETYESTRPNLEVRIGAIYALERIAQDSARDHIQIMEILCAYIRENAPALPPVAAGDSAPEPRTDIQVALEVIGRRGPGQIALERARHESGSEAGYRLDLRGTNLQGTTLAGLDFDHARLNDAQLQRANLIGAQLQRADLWGAQLQGADLTRAQLQRANLWNAQLQGARLNDAQLQGANLTRVRLQGARLWFAQLQGADLSGAQLDEKTSLDDASFQGARVRKVDWAAAYLSQAQADAMFGDASVVLPGDLTRPAHWPDADLEWSLFDDGDNEFNREYRAWLADPASYTPPQNRP